jgi:hypothetical protein
MKKLRNLVFVLALLLIGAGNVTAQESCKRDIESQGGLSICIPHGWTVEEDQETDVNTGQKHPAKYKMLFAPKGENFRPNINFKEENNSSTLDDYLTASIKIVLSSQEKLGVGGLKVVSQDRFSSTSGVSVAKVVFQIEYKGFVVRTIQYYFDVPGRKVILTGTTLEKDSATLDPVFDGAARSFRLERTTDH